MANSVVTLLRIYIYMAWWLEWSPMARETWVQSQVESYQRLKKWYLRLLGLTLSIIRYGSRVKWDNPGKGEAPSPIPWCSSYRNESLQVTLVYGRQLYLLLLIYIYIYIYNYYFAPLRVFTLALADGFSLKHSGLS